eukprot:COSAG01_NODE_6882_length_3453_cov_28.777877_3_plen_69_part_00
MPTVSLAVNNQSVALNFQEVQQAQFPAAGRDSSLKLFAGIINKLDLLTLKVTIGCKTQLSIGLFSIRL